MQLRHVATVFTLLAVGSQVCCGDVAPENSYLSCRPYAAQADGQQACRVRLTLHGRDGLPAAGQTVRVESDRGELDMISPASAETDVHGIATFEVRSQQAGTATLTGFVEAVAIAREIVSEGAVGLYTFDGDSPEARVRDLSGHNNHGLLHGPCEVVAGRAGEGLRFSGPEQAVEIPHHESLSGRHGSYVEAWICPDASISEQQIQTIAAKSPSHHGDYRLSLRGQKLAYHYRSSQRAQNQLEEALSELDVIETEEWSFVAGFWEGTRPEEIVRGSGYVRAYVSGTERFETMPAAQQVEGIWNARSERQPLTIGRLGTSEEPFVGILDEVRIYSRALNDEEMRRNHEGVARVSFGIAAPANLTVDAASLPECIQLKWDECTVPVTTYRLHRSRTPDFEASDETLLRVLPHSWPHFRDYDVEPDCPYYYSVVAESTGNQSAMSTVVAATSRRAPAEMRWYRGDGHLHTYTHDDDVEDFTPEDTLGEARKQGWDFALVTEHNSLGSWLRAEEQATERFVVFGNGQEISDGGKHRTGAFLKQYVPTSDLPIEQQNAQALAMGGEVGPNHSAYQEGPYNITLFELVNHRKWFPLASWEDDYLKKGIHVMAKGGSDAHGRFSVKRGIRWCVWADRFSYTALKSAIQAGRTLAVDGDGLLCMLRVNGAMIGDTLTAEPGTSLQIEISADSDSGNIDHVRLIKFGEQVKNWEPAAKQWKQRVDGGKFDGTPTYYRIEVSAGGTGDGSRKALSSALFIRPPQPPQN